MTQINSLAPQDVKLIIVGNKIDMEGERLVSVEEGMRLAEKYNIPFFEASAKTGHNVSEVFHAMGGLVLERAKKNQNNDTERTNQQVSVENLQGSGKKKQKCCK